MNRRVFLAITIVGLGILYALSGTIWALALLIGSVMVPIAGILLSRYAGKRLRVQMTFSEVVEKGRGGVGSLCVENPTIFPLTSVCLSIQAQNALTGEEILVPLRCSVPPVGSTRVEFYLGSAYCGKLTLSCGQATIYDGFGLVPINLKPNLTITRMVLPSLFPMHVLLTGSETYVGDEDFQRNQKGQDWSTPFQLRDYAQGDSLKQIHWKMSCKLDRYIVRDPSLTLDRALLVLWDIASMPEQASPAALDAMAEALVAFCLALAEDEIPYSLGWCSLNSSNLEVRDVNTREDFFDLLPEILCASKDMEILDCLHTLRGRRFSMVAYFSGKLSKGLAELAGMGKTTVFFCDSDGEGCSAGDLNCWIFSPVDYKTALRDVTV